MPVISISEIKQRVHELTGEKIDTDSCVKIMDELQVQRDNIILETLAHHQRMNDIRRIQKLRQKKIISTDSVSAVVSHINGVVVHPLSADGNGGGGDTKTQQSDTRHSQNGVRPS